MVFCSAACTSSNPLAAQLIDSSTPSGACTVSLDAGPCNRSGAKTNMVSGTDVLRSGNRCYQEMGLDGSAAWQLRLS
jgi:hypothetical protein